MLVEVNRLNYCSRLICRLWTGLPDFTSWLHHTHQVRAGFVQGALQVASPSLRCFCDSLVRSGSQSTIVFWVPSEVSGSLWVCAKQVGRAKERGWGRGRQSSSFCQNVLPAHWKIGLRWKRVEGQRFFIRLTATLLWMQCSTSTGMLWAPWMPFRVPWKWIASLSVYCTVF